jgi:hypothetical protein
MVTYSRAIDNECVVVDTVDFDSTSELLQDDKSMITSKAIKKGFKSQLIRTINYKIGLQQYVGGKPVILGINAFEWRYMFEHDYDEYVELRDTIQNTIKRTNWLSGVIIYYSDFYNGRYIENENAANEIQVTDKELQTLGIIREYNDPIITHDRKINLTVLNSEQQIQKLESLVEKEPTLRLREDKLELLEHIATILLNKELPVSLIEKMQPIIKNYCNSTDPASESTSLKINSPESGIFSYPTLRSNASTCQLRITWHVPTSENKELCLKMLKDENTLVREEVCKNLSFLAAVDYQQSLEIARKILEDNWRVRFSLTEYLHYLARNQKPELLDLCREIICKFGKTEKLNGQGENALLKFVISIIVVKALCEGVIAYKMLLDELLEGPYNFGVKNEIAFQCKREEILEDDSRFDSAIPIFLELAEHNSETVRNNAIFLLCHSLVSLNKSRLPKIRPFLDIAVKEKHEYQGAVHTDFQILKYLDKFWEEFPQDCAMYFLTVFDNNPNPEMYMGYSNAVANLLNNLLTSTEVSDTPKSNLRKIVKTLRNANPYFASLLKDLG